MKLYRIFTPELEMDRTARWVHPNSMNYICWWFMRSGLKSFSQGKFCILGATKRSFFLYELKQFLKIHLIGNNQPLRDYRFCNCLSLMSISISATDHALDLTKRIVFVKTISWTVLKNLIPQIFPWHYFATVFWNLIALQKIADIQSTMYNDHFDWNLF